MLQILSKNHALTTTVLHFLKKSLLRNHHYLAPPSSLLNRIFVSQHSRFTPPRTRSLKPSVDINTRHFCSEEYVELEKRLVLSNVVDDAVTNENNALADKVVNIVMNDSRPELTMEDALRNSGIELTAPLVMEVLQRLHHEEEIALRFFMWARCQENYVHETSAYNSIIDMLSSSNFKLKHYRIMCDLLDYMKRNKRKGSVPDDALLLIVRRYSDKHLAHLQMFVKKVRFRRMRLNPETFAFNLLLDALCKSGLAEMAEAMFRRVHSKVKPNADTYNILFFGWCQVINPRRGMILLEEMITLGFTPDTTAYNAAICTFCKLGLITEAAELLKFMTTRGSTVSAPTQKTYCTMILALVKNDSMEECFELLGDMIRSGCLPDVSTYKELMEGMCLNGKIEAAYRVLEEISRNGYPPDVMTYNCFIEVLCDNKESDEVLRLYKKMIEVGCMPSVQTYNMIIQMYYTIGDVEAAFDTWEEMDRRGCMRNIDTCCVMIEGLFESNKAKDACSLLEEVISEGAKLPYDKFESFLTQLSAIGDLQLIHRLSDHMRKFYIPSLARRIALSQQRHRKFLGTR